MRLCSVLSEGKEDDAIARRAAIAVKHMVLACFSGRSARVL